MPIVSQYDDCLGGRDVFALLSATLHDDCGENQNIRTRSTDPTDPSVSQRRTRGLTVQVRERLPVWPIGLQSLIFLGQS